jgi:methylphosphotriester-DNA--protein-cysteine methyltransferase
MINACTTTRIYCRPGCPPGRRTRPEHRVAFASTVEARAAGFRACKVCLPDTGPAGPYLPKRQRLALAGQR